MLKNLLKRNSFLKQYQTIIHQINLLENDLKGLNESELRAKSLQLEKNYATNSNLEVLIPEAFALTREASVRTLGLRHFDVQLIGGLV